MVNRDTWVASQNEEHFTKTEEFATREEAIAFGKAEFEGRFWVARAVEYQPEENIGKWLTSQMLEALSEHASEVGGEHAEDWPAGKQEEILAILLQELANVYVREINPPDFFLVEDVEEIK